MDVSRFSRTAMVAAFLLLTACEAPTNDQDGSINNAGANSPAVSPEADGNSASAPAISGDETSPPPGVSSARVALDNGLIINFWEHQDGERVRCGVVPPSKDGLVQAMVSTHDMRDSFGRSLSLSRMGQTVEVLVREKNGSLLMRSTRASEIEQAQDGITIKGPWQSGDGVDLGQGQVSATCR